MIKAYIYCIMLAVTATIYSCGKADTSPAPVVAPPPATSTGSGVTNTLSITSYSQYAGRYNSTVEINGTGFSALALDNIVTLNGTNATVTTASTTKLVINIPKGAGTGAITVTNNGKTATGPVFSYQLTPKVSIFAGSGQAATIDGVGTNASFTSPYAITADKYGNIYVADNVDNVIRRISSNGAVVTVAGSGKPGFANGTGAQASFSDPEGITTDRGGNVYVADRGNGLIRQIRAVGVVSTFAGNRSMLVSKDGRGTAATFKNPLGMAADTLGNLYVLDGAIRKITSDGAEVTTITNTTGFIYSNLTSDVNGNIYVTTGKNNTILKVTPQGLVTTYAGSGMATSNEGSLLTASFNNPLGIAIDKAGNLIVAENSGDYIRNVLATGTVNFITYPKIENLAPYDVAIDIAGSIFITSPKNHYILKIVLE